MGKFATELICEQRIHSRFGFSSKTKVEYGIKDFLNFFVESHFHVKNVLFNIGGIKYLLFVIFEFVTAFPEFPSNPWKCSSLFYPF